MSTVTPLEHTAIGALAGVTEVSIMQPTVGIKNALQEGRPVPRTLATLYRGVGVRRRCRRCPAAPLCTAAPIPLDCLLSWLASFATPWERHRWLCRVAACFAEPAQRSAASILSLRACRHCSLCWLQVSAGAMLPITSVQFGMNRLLEQTYKRSMQTDHIGFGGTIAVAMGAGASSAILGCPAEFVMIQQQKAGRTLPAEFRHIVSTYGLAKPMKGLSATVIRESLYACGYLAVAPMLREVLQEQPAVAKLPGGPLVLSGIAAGLLATVCTQPADTIKTRMQAFPDSATHPQYRSLMSTTRHIVQTEGVGTFFAGLGPRAIRIVAAVFILNGMRTTIVDALQQRRTAALV